MRSAIHSNPTEITATLASLLFDVANDQGNAGNLDKKFIFSHMASVLDLSDRDFGRAVNLLLSLADCDDDLVKIVELLATPSSAKHNGLQLQFLVYLYNDTGRPFVFAAIVKAAARFRMLDRLSAVLENGTQSVSKHLDRLSVEERKTVLSSLAAYNVAAFALPYLQLADPVADKVAVLKCVGSLVRLNNFQNLGQAVSCACVADNSVLLEFVRLLVAGDAAGFEAFAVPETIDDFFDNLELTFDQCLEKVRLLGFVRFAGGRVGRPVSYADAMDALQISNDLLLESLAIDAIKSGLVDAQIDQQSRIIRILNSRMVQWNAERWESLATSLDGVITTLDR